jgi:hypothetical protein
MNLGSKMPLKHKAPTVPKQIVLTPQREIITNPKKCILKNKLWRGDIIPLIPIQRNYFILHEHQYDIDRMKFDLGVAELSSAWANKDMHSYKWKSITLNSYEGNDQSLLNESSIDNREKHKYIPTDTLHLCNYFREILQAFNTDIYLVRLLRLDAGGKIKFHTDEKVFKQRYDIIRCHIPITTHPDCKFQLGYPRQRPASGTDGIWNADILHSCFLTPGYLWFTNVNALHGVENNSDIDRVHLVIDMKPTKEMLHRIYGI